MSTHASRTIRAFLQPLLIVAALAFALWLIHNRLGQYNLAHIRESLRQIPKSRLLIALGLAAANYIVLIGYDWLALKNIGRDLSVSRMALASFTGFVASFNFGALLGGTSVRTRLYTHWGLSAVEIAQLVVQVGVTFWLGVFALAGLAMIVDPVSPFLNDAWSHTQLRALGVALLLVVLGWFGLAMVRREPIGWRTWQISLPKPLIAVAQVAVAAGELCLAAGCLYALLPTEANIGFLYFVTVYCLAMLAVIATHVPGGIGVFEATVLALTGDVDRVGMLGALLAFRVVYFLLPLALAIVLLAINEVSIHRRFLKTSWRQAERWLEPVMPSLLAGGVAMCGAALLFSSATPAVHERLVWLMQRLPLGLIESAHFASSLVGMGLLLSASGLHRRLAIGWRLTAWLLGLGIIFALVKGRDIEEAMLLALGLAILWPSRSHFYRQGTMLRDAFTPGWIVAVVVIFLCAIWIGYVSYRNVPYVSELWWTSSIDHDVPRFLRASVGAAALLIVVFGLNLIAPHPPKPTTPTDNDLNQASTIIRRQSDSWPNVALLGDKAILFNPARTAFLMYGIRDRTWVVMGDPVGPREEWPELVWQFRTLCDGYGGRPIFYLVHPDNLAIYQNQGLTLLKLGEEARVAPEQFTLPSEELQKWQAVRQRWIDDGYQFEVYPAERVAELMPELQDISQQWLAARQTRENGFSLGAFRDDYMSRFSLAILRHRGQLVAFTNLWQGGDREEYAPDLIRYRPEVPADILDYLFLELILWGHQQGIRWFNLGMAPLAGVPSRPLAPLWNHTVGIVYRHGQHFENPEELRRFKERFRPHWTPRYLASPGGLELPHFLKDLRKLIEE